MNSLKTSTREYLGTRAAKASLALGKIPAVVYANKKEPLHILINENDISKIYKKKYIYTQNIKLDIEGKEHDVIVKEVKKHYLKDKIIHIDFMHLNKTQLNLVKVPIKYISVDKSVGVKRGGFFNIIRRHINLLCPWNNIPEALEIDVQTMEISHKMNISMIKIPNGCKVMEKKDCIIASIIGRKGKGDDEDAAEESGKEGVEAAKKES